MGRSESSDRRGIIERLVVIWNDAAKKMAVSAGNRDSASSVCLGWIGGCCVRCWSGGKGISMELVA